MYWVYLHIFNVYRVNNVIFLFRVITMVKHANRYPNIKPFLNSWNKSHLDIIYIFINYRSLFANICFEFWRNINKLYYFFFLVVITRFRYYGFVCPEQSVFGRFHFSSFIRGLFNIIGLSFNLWSLL